MEGFWRRWIRRFPGIWFALYIPIGIALILASHDMPFLLNVRAVWVGTILGLVNFILLFLCRRKADGQEHPWTRWLFIFVPAASAATLLFFFRSDFDNLGAIKLNYIFNMMYAGAAFGFWLPADEARTGEEARIYYEEYRTYLWPAIFLTVVSFVSGVWMATLREMPQPGALAVMDFLFLTYIGLGFGSSIPCLYSHINGFRSNYLSDLQLQRLCQLHQKLREHLRRLSEMQN